MAAFAHVKKKAQQTRLAHSLAVCVPLVLLASCGRPNMRDYMAIHRDGIAKLTAARQIDGHYSQVDHFITHFGFGKQPLTWNTQTFIEGRFTLTLQVPVVVDYSKRTVTQAGEPKFYLVASDMITVLPGDRTEMRTAVELSDGFGEAEWTKFVSSGFDLTTFGVPKSEIHPVANFGDYVRVTRRDRVQIK